MPIQIRFNDVDRYGHVNNNAYFAFYDLGKVDYLNTVLALFTKQPDIVPLVANVQADFYSPIFYGDEIIVETCIPKIGTKSFTLYQRAVNVKSKETVCACKTIMVCYSLKSQQSVKIPEKYKMAIEKYEKQDC